MCLDKTALLDHLVGEREHPWRYVDSERPRCLNVRRAVFGRTPPEGGWVKRLESTLDGAFAQDPPGADRLRKALRLDRAEFLVLEQAAAEPARARLDHDTVWRGESLQPRRDVRRLADDAALLRFA